MKVFKKITILFVLMISFFIVGCQSNDYKHYVFNKFGNEIDVKMYPKDNLVNKLDVLILSNKDVLGEEKYNELKRMEPLFKNIKDNLKGMNVEIEFPVDKVKFHITVDFDKLDIENLKLLLQNAGGGNLNISEILGDRKLSDMENKLKSVGFEEKK